MCAVIPLSPMANSWTSRERNRRRSAHKDVLTSINELRSVGPMALASATDIAEALAAASPDERRAVLEQADRLRRQQCCGDGALPELLDADRAHRAAEVAKALADPVRVQLLQLLRDHGQEVCQCDVQPLFELSQPTLSHHLRKLAAAKLIRAERRGKWTYYTADDDTLEVVKTWLA